MNTQNKRKAEEEIKKAEPKKRNTTAPRTPGARKATMSEEDSPCQRGAERNLDRSLTDELKKFITERTNESDVKAFSGRSMGKLRITLRTYKK